MTDSRMAQVARVSADARQERSQLKDEIYGGNPGLRRALLEYRHGSFRNMTLIEYTRWCYTRRRGEFSRWDWLRSIGNQALRDRINLAVTVSRASERSIQWLQERLT